MDTDQHTETQDGSSPCRGDGGDNAAPDYPDVKNIAKDSDRDKQPSKDIDESQDLSQENNDNQEIVTPLTPFPLSVIIAEIFRFKSL